MPLQRIKLLPSSECDCLLKSFQVQWVTLTIDPVVMTPIILILRALILTVLNSMQRMFFEFALWRSPMLNIACVDDWFNSQIFNHPSTGTFFYFFLLSLKGWNFFQCVYRKYLISNQELAFFFLFFLSFLLGQIF